MTINFNTLFAYLGQAANIASGIYAAHDSTFEVDVRALQDALDSETQEVQARINPGMNAGLSGMQSSLSSAVGSLAASPSSTIIVETIHADTPLRNKSISSALTVLIDQMDDNAESVDSSAVTTSVSYGEGGSSSGIAGDNVGTGIIVLCTKRGDGRVNEFILGETIRCEVVTAFSDGSATWRLTGEPSYSKRSVNWPGGSGIYKTLTSYVGTSSTNLIPNGDFSDESDVATYLPEGWILDVGTLGTTLLVTQVETQTVTINGDPEGGFYTLSFTDNDGRTYMTEPLAYNAGSSSVQSALQALPWLGSVTVSSSGTSPNYTHTITFLSTNNPSTLTYDSSLTGGTPTITIAVVTPGSNGVMRGDRALEFNGNGSEATTIYAPVRLSGTTCYCCNIWALCDIQPAAGELTIDLVDGIDGTAVDDDQGNSNSFTVDLTALGTFPTAFNGCFHTPSNMPPKIYVRFKLTTALSNTSSLFIDEAILVPMTKLYNGGLYAAAFSGSINLLVGDEATLTITNDRAGALHEWLNRFLSLDSKDILLPTASVGTQDDSLIA